MSSPSAAVNGDASMVQGRPLSSEANEKAALGGIKAMHISGNGNPSHTTAGMGETAAKQSNKHSNADGDHDSGVDENTQHPGGESPTKKMGSGGAATRIPKKTPPTSPTKPANRSRASLGLTGAGRVPRSKSVPKPFTSWATPPSTSDSAKKVSMNKIKVGMSQSPNIKQVKSKVGSLSNATHRAGGGDIRIEHRKLDWKADAKTSNLNSRYKPGGGDKKIENRKLEWNTSSRVGSLGNAKHKAGGGNVKIVDQKIQIKVHQSKIGSLDNVKHRPGGGDKKVFNDVEYMRQVSDHAVSITNASGPGSLTSSRRESSSQSPLPPSSPAT